MAITAQQRQVLARHYGGLYTITQMAMWTFSQDHMMVNPASHNRGRADTDMMRAGNDMINGFLAGQGFPMDDPEMVVFTANLVEDAMGHDANQEVLGTYPFEHAEGGRRLSFLVARDMNALPNASQHAVKGAIDKITEDVDVMLYYGVREITSAIGKRSFIAGLRRFYLKQTTPNANVSPSARTMIHGWSFRDLAHMIHQADIRNDGFLGRLNAAAFNNVVQENGDVFVDGDTFNLARIVCESFIMELRERAY